MRCGRCDKRSARGRLAGLAAAGLLLVSLANCSPGPFIDKIPTELGGLPADAPQRPAAPPSYPAVHDVPAPRGSGPMSTEDQLRIEEELATARERQNDLKDPKFKERASAAAEKANAAIARAAAAAKTRKKPPETPPDRNAR